MSGGAYESDLLNLREQAMRNRSLASHRLFRVPTFLPKIDENPRPRERAVVADGLVESRIACRADGDRVVDLHRGKDRDGQEARAGAAAGNAKQVAYRLHRNAIKMYPVSRYALQHSGGFSVVALLARLWRPF
jgi:hypothetical protein